MEEKNYSNLYEHPSDMDIKHYEFYHSMLENIPDELHPERQLDYPLKQVVEELDEENTENDSQK